MRNWHRIHFYILIALAVVILVVLTGCASDTKDVESLRTPETTKEVEGPKPPSTSEVFDVLPPPPMETWSSQAAFDATMSEMTAFHDTPGWDDDYSCPTLMRSARLWSDAYWQAPIGSNEDLSIMGLTVALTTATAYDCL